MRTSSPYLCLAITYVAKLCYFTEHITLSSCQVTPIPENSYKAGQSFMHSPQDHIKDITTHKAALLSIRHTWWKVEANPMPMFVMPQISIPIIARNMRFNVHPAAPTNGVIAACRSKAAKLLAYKSVATTYNTASHCNDVEATPC